MGTLVANAAAVKAASTAIDAAIVAKGGSTAGGLTNAAAAIAALPSGGWPLVPWREDGKCHFWFQIPNNPNKTISFFFEIISNGNVTVNWGDGQTDTVSGSTDFSTRTFTHTYSAQGDYEVVMTNITSVRLGDWNFGSIGGGVTRDYIRQIEMDCACVLQNGNWYHFRYLLFLCGVRMSSCNLISNMCFELDASLASVGDLSACTSIGGSAFYCCSLLASVGDLSACTSIGGSAFYGCSSLATIGDLSACTSIGNNAFQGCSSLASVGDISACTSIGGSAFQGCSSLATIGDLSACTSIDWRAFQGCSSLASVGDLSACTSIGGSAFQGCSSLATIGDLSACTSIGNNAFQGCSSLASVGDISACTSIGGSAFQGCSSLASVGDLSALTTLPVNLFYGCSSLTSLPLMPNITTIASSSASADSVIGYSGIRTIGGFPNMTTWGHGSLGHCESLETIGEFTSYVGLVPNGAFWEDTNLQSVSIPNATGCESWGFNFNNCRKINSITLGVCTQFGNSSFTNCGINNTPDENGIKCTITVGNTISSLRGLTGYTFPFSAPITTKFVCADGYIVYENGAWTNHPNA